MRANNQRSDNLWIDCLSNFAKLLNMTRTLIGNPIRIAIIDDGVDADLISLEGKIASGKSFCYYVNSTDRTIPYYVPAGNHGTCMATLICKICPHVKLYIARLDERLVVGKDKSRRSRLKR